jgi:DNA polymerase I
MATRLFDSGATDVLYLVDLSGYVFRAYHAIAPLTSPTGEPTQAVLGTVNMLERLVRQCKPHLLAVAMDSRIPTFRKVLYPEYKANRPPPPDDLKQQMRRVSELMEAFPLPCFQVDGFEADDLIATIVKHARAAGLRVVIVSADKDLMQLVSPDVILWDTMRDKVFGPDEVSERFQVPVSAVRDVLALMGDSSDNIPGVPSVGPKTAAELLATFGTLEAMYERLDEIPRKKLRETLSEHKASALMSQRLVTLDSSVAFPFDPSMVVFERRTTAKLRALYAELGFQRHLAALDASVVEAPASAAAQASPLPPPAATLETILERAQLDRLELEMRASGRLCLALISEGSFPMTQTVVGIGLSPAPGISYYLPVGHRYMGAPKQLPLGDVALWMNGWLAAGTIAVGVFDGESCMVALQRQGIALNACAFDALIASYLLDVDAANDLGRLVQSQLGIVLPIVAAPTRRNAKVTTEERSVEELATVVAAQAEALQRLWSPLVTKLEEEGLSEVWQTLDQPISALLAHIEQTGICLDAEALRKLGREVGQQLVELEAQAHQLYGKEFNVNSPRQLEKILFDDLGLKPIKRTKTSRSTDAETLEALADEHPLPKVILEVRQLAKLKGTYIDSLPLLVNPKTQRLHTHWRQEIAATGRLSSTDPNLQNIPIRTELGKKIREAFIAADGCQLVSADYSQIELRVLAHLSKDPTLVDAFRTGQDIHQRTAMEIFEVPAEGVNQELRRRAKAVNFGVIYGQGDSALSKSLGISRAEAGQFIAAYFRRYAGVTRFMDETLLHARASGSVRTLLGRRRVVPDIHSANRANRLAAERIVMNTPIQGTAADLLKLAMLKLAAPVTPGSRMLLTVHDELVFEVPDAEVAEAKERIRRTMEAVFPLDVPLLVEVGAGKNWRAAH